MSTTTITLNSVFTDEQISDLFLTYARCKKFGIGGNLHAALVTALQPLMAQVDQITGIENDASYWAYAVENAFNQQ